MVSQQYRTISEWQEAALQIPLQITFKNIKPSEAIETRVRDKAVNLERFAHLIMRCHVIIEEPHKHHHKGNLFQVSIDMTLPGGEIVANRHPDEHQAFEDVYVAIRDAFDHARRQLEDYERKRRGKVKAHETLPFGVIMNLVPEEDYGIIAGADGHEIYFHRNSVVGADFDELLAGQRVHYNEEMGEKGPQASTVHVEGKHHVVG